MRRDYNIDYHEVYCDRLFSTDEVSLAQDGNTLTLLLKRPIKYRLNFNQQFFKNNNIEKLTIEGRNSVILFWQGDVDCNEVSIVADSLAIEPEFKLKTKHLKLNLQNTFYNSGYFEINDLEVESAENFINAKHGRLRIEKARINVNDFIEEGTSYINYAEIFNESLNIYGNFSVLSCIMRTRNSLYFHAGSTVEFFERLECLSENDNFFLNGTLRRNKYFSTENNSPAEFICSAINIYLAENSHIDACKKIRLNAIESLKSDCGSIITKNTMIIATAPMIIFDGKCQSKRQIHLKAERYCKTGNKSDFESPLIEFSGNLVYLHGIMAGKVAFPGNVQQLYLAQTSVIQNCPEFIAIATCVESFGKIQSAVLRIRAYQQLFTNQHTYYDSREVKLQSLYGELQGTFLVDDLAAAGNFIKTNSLTFPRKSQLTIYAADLQLSETLVGNQSSLNIQAGKVLNESRITGFSDVQICGSHFLINMTGSAIESARLFCRSKTLIQDGALSSNQRAELVAENDLCLGENAKINSPEVTAVSKKDIQIAGDIEANLMVILQAQNILRFLKYAKVKALGQAQFSANKISGNPQLEMNKGVLCAGNEICLNLGLIKALDEVIFVGKLITVHVDLQGGKFRFTRGKNVQNSHFHLGNNAAVDCDYLDSNHDSIHLAADLQKVKELVLHNTNTVALAVSAKMKNSNKISIKTKEAKIDGDIDSGDKLNPSMFILEAEKAHFTKTSHIGLEKAQITVEDVDFDGSFRVRDYILIMKNALYKRNASMRVRGTAMITDSDPVKKQLTRLCTLNFALGCFHSARNFLITNTISLTNQAVIRSKNMQWDIQKICNETTGRIGSEKSTITIQSEKFIHKGIIEAGRLDIKCDDYFLQLMGGIKATQFNLLTPFYFNFLGRTQAQQASFTSYLSLRLALEEITFGYGNSFYTIRCLPIIPYFDGLAKMAEDYRKGNINIWDPNYLQYITPLSLRILKTVHPLLSNLASLGLNTWYLGNALTQLGKFSYGEWSGKAVDLLPPLVSVKNAFFSLGFLAQDGLSVLDKLVISAPEWLFDSASMLIKTQKLIFDSFEDVWIFIQKITDEISDFFFPIKSGKKDPQYSEDEQKKLDAINKELNNKDYKLSKKNRNDLEGIKKKIENHEPLTKKEQSNSDAAIKQVAEHEKAEQLAEQQKEKEREQKNEEGKKELMKSEPTLLQQVEHVFDEWVLPTLLLVLPRFTEDAFGFGQFFAPSLTGVRSERDLLFSISILSQTIAVSSNRQTFGFIYCPDPQYAYNANFFGHDVYLGGNSLIKNLSVTATHFYLREGNAILCFNAALDVENLTPENVKAAHYYLKWQTVRDEKDLLELNLNGRWSLFNWAGIQSVAYETNHPLHFQNSFYAEYSYTYKAPQITVDKDVTLTSKNTVGMISTQASLKIDGKLQGKTIIEESADKIEQQNGSVVSDNLYMHARYGMNFNRSNIDCKIIFISSDFGDINNIGAYIKAAIFMSVDAKRGNVHGQCIERNIKTHGAPDKKHEGGVFEGGTGYGFDLVGLAVHGGILVINDGDFKATGNFYVVGDFGVIGVERHNYYIYKNKQHLNWNLSYHKEVVMALRIKRPGFKSKEGIVFVSAPWGAVDVTCPDFEARRTWVYSYDEALFKEIEGKEIIFSEDQSIIFLGYGSKSIESKHEFYTMKIKSPEEIGVIVAHGNVILPATLDTKHLVTMPLRGNTYLINHKVAHELHQVYSNFGVHAGPFQFSLSANPRDPHPMKVALKLGPVDQMKGAANAKSKGELAGHLINIANSGEADLQECTSVGVSVGSTESNAYFETPGPHYLRIGRWDDYGIETYIIGFVGGLIHQLRLHRAIRFVVLGPELDYQQSSHSIVMSLNYHFMTNTVSGSEQLESSSIAGHNIALAHLIVNELFCRNSLQLNLNNAKLVVHHLQGKIQDVYLHTTYHDYSQNSYSGSLSTDGNVGIQRHSKEGHERKKAAEFQLDDADDGQVINIHSDGGRVSGKAFEKIHPNSVEQTPNHSWVKEKGLGISVNLNSQRVNSVSFQNSYEGYTESIQVTPDGLRMTRNDFYHGTKIEITIPYVLMHRIEQWLNPPKEFHTIENFKKQPILKTPTAYKVVSQSKKNLHPTKKNQDFQLHYSVPFNPQHYAQYFDPSKNPQREIPQKLQNAGITFGQNISLFFPQALALRLVNKKVGSIVLPIPDRFNYPIGDYGIAALKGGRDVALSVWDLAKGVSLWWTDSALRAFNLSTPKSIARIEQRWEATKNLVHIVIDLGAYYEASCGMQYAPKNAQVWNHFLQTQAKVQEDFQPLLTAVGNGASWIWNDATGPEILERAVAFWAPYKLATRIGELWNLHHYGITTKPPLFPHVDGIKEPHFAPRYPISDLKKAESDDHYRYLISPKGELIIFDEDFALPHVLAAGEVEFSGGRVVSIYREKNPMYFSRDKNLADFVENCFVNHGCPEARATFNVEDFGKYTAKELIHAPEPIYPFSWNNPYFHSIYLTSLQMHINTNSDDLSDSRPWRYTLNDYASAAVIGLWHVFYEPLSLLYDGVIATGHSIAAEQAKAHWRNSFFAKIGEFTVDAIRQYALKDLIHHRSEDDPFYQEFLKIQARQNARIDSFRASMDYLLFSAPGPVVVEAATELVIPSAAIKAVIMMKNYHRFGTLTHPPLFSPIIPRSEFSNYDFVNGTDNIENYFLTFQKIREERMNLDAMFVITKEGKLIITDDITDHPILADFQDVALAGRVGFEDGILTQINAGSGNYKPWGKNLEQIATHVFVKEGFTETPGAYKTSFGIRQSENPQILHRQWLSPLLGFGLSPYPSQQDVSNTTNPVAIKYGIAVLPTFFVSNPIEVIKQKISHALDEEVLGLCTLEKPDEVFSRGFKAPGSNLNLEQHFLFKEKSAYVSTYRTLDVAVQLPNSMPPGVDTKFLYVISPQENAQDVVKTLYPDAAENNPADLSKHEKIIRAEMAVPYEIKSQDILGAWKVKMNFIQISDPNDPALLARGYPKETIHHICYRPEIAKMEFIPNPYYIPFRDKFMTFVWRGCGHLVVSAGIAIDGNSLYHEWRNSQSSGNYTNTYREGSRIVGGWSGMLVEGTAGAEVGALIGSSIGPIGTPIGALIFGAIGSFAGYQRGSTLATDTFDAINEETTFKY